MRIKPDINPKTKTKSRKRAIHYNLVGNPEEERSIYYFRFCNTDKREIENITGIIYGRVQKPIEVLFTISGKISDLHYRILGIDTHNTRIDLASIKELYNGPVIKDNRLYERKTLEELEKYAVGEFIKEEGLEDIIQ